MRCRAVSCAADITVGVMPPPSTFYLAQRSVDGVRKRTRLANTVKGFALGQAPAISKRDSTVRNIILADPMPSGTSHTWQVADRTASARQHPPTEIERTEVQVKDILLTPGDGAFIYEDQGH